MFKILRKWKWAFASTTLLTCFLPWPAQAGPLAALVPIITSIAGGASATAVLGQLALSALVVGANMIIQKMLMPKQKVVGVKDKLQTGGNLPLSILMGNAMTAGKLIYVNQGGNSLNNMLTLVIGISQIPVTSYSTKIWINNELCDVDLAGSIPEADAPGGSYGFYPITQYDKLSTSKYDHQYCWMKFYDGTQTTPDQYLRDTFGADPDKPWTSNMIGRGQAYVIVVCRYSALGIWSGVPSFKFEVKGAKLYDMSKDSTNGGSGSQRWATPSTWAFSDNPKVMISNLIFGIYYNNAWIYGGQDVSLYQLPSDYWIAAIAHCAATVTTADARTISRYTACCEIDVDQQPLDIIKELDKCCAGYTMEYGGTWKTYAGPPGSSVLTITDENAIISEDQTDDLYRPAQDTFNGARATFLSQKAGWVMKDVKPYIDATFQTEDGELQLIADMEFPMVTEITQVRRLMRLAVRDSRKQRTHVIQLPPAAMLLEPWSVINWNSDRNGYVNKKFTVQSIDDLPNCNQGLLIREVDTTDYDYDNTYDTIEPVGVLTPVKPGALALDFTVSPDQVDKVGTPGAKDKPAIKIDWTWGITDSDLKWIKWEVRISATQTKVIASGTFHNMSDNTKTITSAAFKFKRSYQIRLFAQPERTWRDSDWTGWKNVTLYDIDIPGAPTLTRVIQQADDGTQVFYLDMTCTALAAEGTYVWRVISGGVTNRFKSDENEQRIPVTSGKTYLVDVRFIADDGGTRGDYSSTASITIAKKTNNMPAVSGLAIVSGQKRNKIDWTDIDDDTYPDYRNTWIWGNTTGTTPTPGTTPPLKRTKAGYFLHDGLNKGQNWSYWVAHKDNSGNFSALAGPVSGAAVAVALSDIRQVSDRSNIVSDPDCIDLGCIIGAGGTVQSIALGNTVVTESANYYQMPATTADLAILTIVHDMAVRETKKYYASVDFGGVAAVSGAFTALLQWYSYDSGTDVSTFISSDSIGSFTGLGRQTKQGVFTAPTGARRAQIAVFKQGGGNVDLVMGSPIFRKATDSDIIALGAVKDGHTDQTAPATPTIALNTFNGDIDGDGKSDIGLSLAITNPNTGVPIKRYIIEISRSDTSGGTYALDTWDSIEAKDFADSAVTTYQFEANQTKFYKAHAKTVAFSGAKGTFTALTSAVQPVAYANTMPTLVWVTPSGAVQPIIAKPKRIVLRWVQISLATYPHAKEIVVYRNTSNNSATAVEIGTAAPGAQRYPDDDDLTAGTTYYYWLKVRDRQNQVSAAFSAVQSIAWRVSSAVVSDGDFDATALAAPTLSSHAQKTPTTNGDGTVTMFNVMAWNSVTNASSYETLITASTTTGGTYTDTGLGGVTNGAALTWTYACDVNLFYKVQVRARNAYGQPGSYSTLSTALQPVAKASGPADPVSVNVTTPLANPFMLSISWAAPTEPDYDHSEVAVLLSVGTPAMSDIIFQTNSAKNEVFRKSVAASEYYYVRHVNRSGKKSSWVGPPVGSFLTSLVDTDSLRTNAVSAWETSNTSGTLSLAAATPTVAHSDTIILTNCYATELVFQFRNISAGSQDITVEFYDNSTSTSLFSIVLTCPSGTVQSVPYYWDAPSSANHAMLINLTSTGGGNVNNRRFSSKGMRR